MAEVAAATGALALAEGKDDAGKLELEPSATSEPRMLTDDDLWDAAPDEYKCPLEMCLLTEDPVLASDGFMYSKKGLEGWIAHCATKGLAQNGRGHGCRFYASEDVPNLWCGIGWRGKRSWQSHKHKSCRVCREGTLKHESCRVCREGTQCIGKEVDEMKKGQEICRELTMWRLNALFICFSLPLPLRPHAVDRLP